MGEEHCYRPAVINSADLVCNVVYQCLSAISMINSAHARLCRTANIKVISRHNAQVKRKVGTCLLSTCTWDSIAGMTRAADRSWLYLQPTRLSANAKNCMQCTLQKVASRKWQIVHWYTGLGTSLHNVWLELLQADCGNLTESHRDGFVVLGNLSRQQELPVNIN